MLPAASRLCAFILDVVQHLDTMQGKLTVVLDLDGTLVSSFTPRRAPHLPPGMNTYLVGKGSQLNPNGVFVVERPELAAFFKSLSSFAGELAIIAPWINCHATWD